MATTQRSLSMKLLIDNKTNKVLFAEAGTDVINFLFDLLTIPVGSIIKLLSTEPMVGCIGNLLKSVETMNEFIIEDDPRYDAYGYDIRIPILLYPIAAAKITHLLTEPSSTTSAAHKYYRCSCHSYFTNIRRIACPYCFDPMTTRTRYVGPNSESVAAAVAKDISGEFVKRGVTYSVMDDLTVTPMSTISTTMVLDKFHVKDLGSLEKRKVNLGMKEVLGLLKASLQSRTVLTDVFIGSRLVEGIAAVEESSSC